MSIRINFKLNDSPQILTKENDSDNFSTKSKNVLSAGKEAPKGLPEDDLRDQKIVKLSQISISPDSKNFLFTVPKPTQKGSAEKNPVTSPVLAQTPKIEAAPSVLVQTDIPKTPGEPPAFVPPTAVVPVADSFWLRAAKSVITGIVWQSGYVGYASALAIMNGMSVNVLPDIIGHSLYVGAIRAAYAFSQSGKTASKQDLSPSPNRNILSKIILSTFAGGRAAAVTAGALLTGTQFFSRSVVEPLFFLIPYAGVMGFVSKLSSYDKKPENSTVNPVGVDAPINPIGIDSPVHPIGIDSLVSPTQVSEPKKPTKSQLAFRAGYRGYCAALAYGIGIAYLLKADPSKVLAPLLTGSIGIGAGLAIRNFKKATPDENLPLTPMKSTLLKIAKSLVAGCNASAATFGHIVTIFLWLRPGQDTLQFLEKFIIARTALRGITQCGQTYAKLSGTTLSEIWKRTPKLVKAGIASASLAGLAALYLGPQAMADKLDDAAFAVKNAGLAAQRQFLNLVYTTDTKTETKTAHEWIQSYDDRGELVRLADLSKNPDFSEFSCAEILNTCDLDETDRGHHKVYRKKSIKFHPDKYTNAPAEDQLLATHAFQALSEASKTLKNHSCPGKDSDMCKSLVEDDVTITKIRETPHWLYAKITGAETSCQLQVAGGVLMPADVKDCSF